MYAVVLMAALTSGQQSPDGFFSHGCHGCRGYSSCSGCHGWGGHGCRGWGCCGYSSCHGCYGCNGCSGCYGGCSGCYGGCSGWGSYGACNGCFGACYGSGYAGWAGYGCWGAPYGGYGVGYGYEGGYACMGGCCGTMAPAYSGMPYSGAPVYPMATTPATPDKPADNGKGKKDESETSAGSRARLVVELPEGAKLFVDDKPVAVAEGRRSFKTPELQKGQTYYYEVRAEVVKEGKPVTETRKVTIKAGDVVREDFRTLGEKTDTAVSSAR